MQDDDRRDAAIKRLRDRRGLAQDLVSYLVVNAFLVGIWGATGAGYFWPAWVLGAWGIGLVMHAWTVFVFQRPISEEDIEREIHRTRPGGVSAT